MITLGVAVIDEIVVELAVTPCDQTTTEGWFAIIGRLYDRHRRRTHLHPYEFPVEVKIIGEELPRLKSCILCTTLGMGSQHGA